MYRLLFPADVSAERKVTAPAARKRTPAKQNSQDNPVMLVEADSLPPTGGRVLIHAVVLAGRRLAASAEPRRLTLRKADQHIDRDHGESKRDFQGNSSMKRNHSHTDKEHHGPKCRENPTLPRIRRSPPPSDTFRWKPVIPFLNHKRLLSPKTGATAHLILPPAGWSQRPRALPRIIQHPASLCSFTHQTSERPSHQDPLLLHLCQQPLQSGEMLVVVAA
jgi:hypothetical protein